MEFTSNGRASAARGAPIGGGASAGGRAEAAGPWARASRGDPRPGPPGPTRGSNDGGRHGGYAGSGIGARGGGGRGEGGGRARGGGYPGGRCPHTAMALSASGGRLVGDDVRTTALNHVEMAEGQLAEVANEATEAAAAQDPVVATVTELVVSGLRGAALSATLKERFPKINPAQLMTTVLHAHTDFAADYWWIDAICGVALKSSAERCHGDFDRDGGGRGHFGGNGGRGRGRGGGRGGQYAGCRAEDNPSTPMDFWADIPIVEVSNTRLLAFNLCKSDHFIKQFQERILNDYPGADLTYFYGDGLICKPMLEQKREIKAPVNRNGKVIFSANCPSFITVGYLNPDRDMLVTIVSSGGGTGIRQGSQEYNYPGGEFEYAVTVLTDLVQTDQKTTADGKPTFLTLLATIRQQDKTEETIREELQNALHQLDPLQRLEILQTETVEVPECYQTLSPTKCPLVSFDEGGKEEQKAEDLDKSLAKNRSSVLLKTNLFTECVLRGYFSLIPLLTSCGVDCATKRSNKQPSPIHALSRGDFVRKLRCQPDWHDSHMDAFYVKVLNAIVDALAEHHLTLSTTKGPAEVISPLEAYLASIFSNGERPVAALKACIQFYLANEGFDSIDQYTLLHRVLFIYNKNPAELKETICMLLQWGTRLDGVNQYNESIELIFEENKIDLRNWITSRFPSCDSDLMINQLNAGNREMFKQRIVRMNAIMVNCAREEVTRVAVANIQSDTNWRLLKMPNCTVNLREWKYAIVKRKYKDTPRKLLGDMDTFKLPVDVRAKILKELRCGEGAGQQGHLVQKW